ncbi:MAG: hypothetical protein IT550_13950 [Novosphingobium sp.]|nr:hypothetical protein [Novosphingobium sp.]
MQLALKFANVTAPRVACRIADRAQIVHKPSKVADRLRIGHPPGRRVASPLAGRACAIDPMRTGRNLGKGQAPGFKILCPGSHRPPEWRVGLKFEFAVAGFDHIDQPLTFRVVAPFAQALHGPVDGKLQSIDCRLHILLPCAHGMPGERIAAQIPG